MSKGFSYSKWDNIELSDDEDDVHPNIDRESWFRLKHRSRVEREDKEEKDTKKIQQENAKSNLRIKEINKILSRASAAANNDDSSDSDDDLEDLDGLRSELQSLENANADGQAKLDHYAANKKWNVDNMFHEVEDRTIVNKNVEEKTFLNRDLLFPRLQKMLQRRTAPIMGMQREELWRRAKNQLGMRRKGAGCQRNKCRGQRLMVVVQGRKQTPPRLHRLP